MFAASGVEGIHNREPLWSRMALVVNRVRDELFGRTEPAHLGHARVGYFGGLIGKLDSRLPAASGSHHSGKFVHSAQGGLIIRGYQLCPDTPACDAGALLFETADDVLIQIVARVNGSVTKPGGIQELSRLDAQIRQVTGI